MDRKKIFIRSNDFLILECHQSGYPDGKIEDLVLLGILPISTNIKSLLFNHYSYTSDVPEIIVSKLNRMKSYPNYMPLKLEKSNDLADENIKLLHEVQKKLVL